MRHLLLYCDKAVFFSHALLGSQKLHAEKNLSESCPFFQRHCIFVQYTLQILSPLFINLYTWLIKVYGETMRSVVSCVFLLPHDKSAARARRSVPLLLEGPAICPLASEWHRQWEKKEEGKKM